jgi:hypothetical protein
MVSVASTTMQPRRASWVYRYIPTLQLLSALTYIPHVASTLLEIINGGLYTQNYQAMDSQHNSVDPLQNISP